MCAHETWNMEHMEQDMNIVQFGEQEGCSPLVVSAVQCKSDLEHFVEHVFKSFCGKLETLRTKEKHVYFCARVCLHVCVCMCVCLLVCVS